MYRQYYFLPHEGTKISKSPTTAVSSHDRPVSCAIVFSSCPNTHAPF